MWDFMQYFFETYIRNLKLILQKYNNPKDFYILKIISIKSGESYEFMNYIYKYVYIFPISYILNTCHKIRCGQNY